MTRVNALPNPSNLAKGMIAIKLREKTSVEEAPANEAIRAIGTKTKRTLNFEEVIKALKE